MKAAVALDAYLNTRGENREIVTRQPALFLNHLGGRLRIMTVASPQCGPVLCDMGCGRFVDSSPHLASRVRYDICCERRGGTLRSIQELLGTCPPFHDAEVYAGARWKGFDAGLRPFLTFKSTVIRASTPNHSQRREKLDVDIATPEDHDSGASNASRKLSKKHGGRCNGAAGLHQNLHPLQEEAHGGANFILSHQNHLFNVSPG